MGKCKQCGKRSIFLKVNEYSLCADCQALNRHIAEECANIIVGNNKSTYKAVDYSQYPKPVKYIKSRSGTRISKNDYSGVFDLSGIKEIENNCYILDSEENRTRALNDIGLMKNVYTLAKDIAPNILPASFNINCVKFDYSPDDDERFVIVDFADKLKSGKIPNERIFLGYSFSDNLHGSITYTTSGISQSTLIISKTTVIENIDCISGSIEAWSVLALHNDDDIEIYSITHNNSGKRDVVYRKQKTKKC